MLPRNMGRRLLGGLQRHQLLHLPVLPVPQERGESYYNPLLKGIVEELKEKVGGTCFSVFVAMPCHATL